MTSIKKLLTAIFALFVIVAFATGCSSSGDSDPDPDSSTQDPPVEPQDPPVEPQDSASVSTTNHSVYLPTGVRIENNVQGDFDGVVVFAGQDSLGEDQSAQEGLGDTDVAGFVAEVKAHNNEENVSAVTETVDNILAVEHGDYHPQSVTPVSRRSEDGGDTSFTIYQLTLVDPISPTTLGNALVQILGINQAGGQVEALPDPPADEATHTTYIIYLTAIYYSAGDVYISIALCEESLANIYMPVLINITSYTNVGSVEATPQQNAQTITAQGGGGMADFLFVVDNSPSMSDEQEAVSRAALDFETAMLNSGLDYRTGVITTDTTTLRDSYSDGPFSNNREEFQEDVIVGASGQAVESGIWSAEEALGPEGSVVSAEHPRDNASLSIVIMSDETDQYDSFSGGAAFNALDNLFIANNYRVYTIVNTDPEHREYGRNYIELSENTEGSYASIDDLSAFSEIMTQIANDAGGASSIYTLEHNAMTNSISVTVNGVVVENDALKGWTYNIGSNAIVFHGDAIPQDGQEVVISYNYLQ